MRKDRFWNSETEWGFKNPAHEKFKTIMGYITLVIIILTALVLIRALILL